MAETSARIRSYIIGFGRSIADITAQMPVSNTSTTDIVAKLEVTKNKGAPTVTITSVTPSSGVLENGVKQVSVTATGTLGDGTVWNSAQIHFGEILDTDASISGLTGNPPWILTHNYHASGLYFIIARATDNLGMVGSDVTTLNLASGVDLHGSPAMAPYISISGIPSSGTIPPTLDVDFRCRMRYWQIWPGDYESLYTNLNRVDAWREREILNINIPYQRKTPNTRVGPLGTTYFFDKKTMDHLYWDFCNGDRSQERGRPRTGYYRPGTYAAVCRYVWDNPSGYGRFYTGDSLQIGWNT